MTKSELIDELASIYTQISYRDVEYAVKATIEYLTNSLSIGRRAEVRGFGSFSLHYRQPRTGRNPKTGHSVDLVGKYVPHFKAGKEMRERVNQSLIEGKPIRLAKDEKEE
jgi:integration host factor subunit beta